MPAGPGTAPLYYLSIEAAARAIRERRLSPVDLVEACLARTEALDGRLHAYITVTAEAALAQARRARDEIAAGHWRGPLHGVPIAHKDNIHTAGVRTTAHSALLRDWVPAADAAVVRLLAGAGAICLGKLSMHEFAYGSPGADEAFPAARNPWDVDRAPGSSSSGSGVAVAAGLCLGATGTDTGGSVRHPAAACGVVGMKPTFGRVSNAGVFPLAPSMDHVGHLTRTVRDSAIMLTAMAGHDTADPYSAARGVPDYAAGLGAPVAGMRAGVPRRFLDVVPHDAQVREAFAAAEGVLARLGVTVVDVEIDGLDRAWDVANVVLGYEAWQYHRANLEIRPQDYGAAFRARVAQAARHTLEDYQAALAVRARLRAAYAGLFDGGIDVLVTPGREAPADAFEWLLANPTARRGATNRMYNLTGMPALTMPMGYGENGLPLALQIAAPHFEEGRIYRLAAAYEDAAGWGGRHPIP